MAASTPIVAAAPEQSRRIQAEFNGAAGEYFRIWIVNLFFSLITLGIFSAWAKVRKKKYFYGSTRFDGDSFDYFADPKAIFRGRMVAAALVIIYAFAAELFPDSRFFFWGLVIVLLPWLVVRTFTFNARNSAWRGIRFDFTATTRETAWVFVGRLIVAVLTLGLGFAWSLARVKSFVVSHHALGTTRFGCEISGRAFFNVYFVSGLIIAAVGVPMGFLSAFALPKIEAFESLSWLQWALPAVALYFGYVVAYAYIQARTTNLLWQGTTGPGMRFESSLAAKRLIAIYLGNILAVACTAGLLIPWAVVRTLRYRLENLALIVDEPTVHEANAALAPIGATGQELGDLFNLDLGL
ncbi:MAG: DUF898 domain-containing protein [Betaproteobacteria bacterium]|nr:DUF898 domain-containing protein [Betaproteobacteria bacterium]